jgi:hypothetical protein
VVLHEQKNQPGVSAVSTLALEVELAGHMIRVLESCHSLWMFDVARLRFCRVPRGARLEHVLLEKDWTPYHQLEVDPATGGFAIALDEAATHLLRSWVHGDHCSHCSNGQQSGEPSREATGRRSRPSPLSA